MTERIAIVGSRTWPTPDCVFRYVASLEPGVVVVSGGADGADSFAADAAHRAGLDCVTHLPDKNRYGVPGCYYHRNLAIVDDSDRLVAFAAKDPKTKRITEGTAMTIELARRAGVPVEVVETPVPGKVCVLIARMRHRFEGIRNAPTPGHSAFRVRSAGELVAELVVVRQEYDRRLGDGWDEIDAETDPAEAERKTAVWTGWLATYETVCDAIDEANAVLAAAPPYAPPAHRKSLHRIETSELVACP